MMDAVVDSTSRHGATTPARVKTNIQFSGMSAESVALQQEIERVARSDAKVLITGESGVGKEIVARNIHSRGPRATHVFAPVNCAGLPETLLESELFGHVKGSFTGAYRDKPGKLETAHMGTIFLDEVGEMTLRMQGLLLRFLETGELQKVGADGSGRIVNVRVIAATNRSLRDMIGQGTFREDLFYRLNVIHILVPPLRERRDDIPMLAENFLGQFTAANKSPIRAISPAAMKAFSEYSWPGNVRELENVIERLVVTVQGQSIELDHLSSEIRHQAAVSFRPAPGAAQDGGGRALQANDRPARILLDDRLSALHGPRDHPQQRARGGAPRPRGGAWQLQDRGETLQYGVARLQAVPELPPQARLPDPLQGIPLGSGPVLRHRFL